MNPESQYLGTYKYFTALLRNSIGIGAVHGKKKNNFFGRFYGKFESSFWQEKFEYLKHDWESTEYLN